jgi:hypothetical protein
MTFDLVAMQRSILKAEIQVYAAVYYFLAIKVDARVRPSVEQLNTITGISLTNTQMIGKEVEILQIVGFKLSYPTVKCHMRIFIDALKPRQAVVDLANFFAEVGLRKFEFLDFRQSILGLTAIILGSAMIQHAHVAMNAMLISHCTEREELAKCIGLLRETAKSIVKNWGRNVAKDVLELASVNFDMDLTPFPAVLNHKLLC